MMRNSKFITVTCFAVILASVTVNAQSIITIKNTLNITRPDELTVLKREFIEKKSGPISDNNYISLKKDGSGKALLVQFDDLNKDGNWDEVVFLYTFQPKEKIRLTVEISSSTVSNPTVRAHVRHRRKNTDSTFSPDISLDSVPAGQPNTNFAKQPLPNLLTEGPAWENDKVGFRIYMDVRNTKDIWGKLTSEMMLDKISIETKGSYHKFSDWGMDILAVGKSLGAGSLALKVSLDDKTDTLVRLGGKNMGKIVYEKVADGPVRAIFRMHYPAWNLLGDNKLVDLIEETSIWGGQYFYQSRIYVINAPKYAEVVTGIVNLKSKSFTGLQSKKYKALYTFDTQSENNDKAGFAIMSKNQKHFDLNKVKTDILTTYLVALSGNSEYSEYRFYSAWEKSDKMFSTKKGVEDYFLKELEKYKSPISVR